MTTKRTFSAETAAKIYDFANRFPPELTTGHFGMAYNRILPAFRRIVAHQSWDIPEDLLKSIAKVNAPMLHYAETTYTKASKDAHWPDIVADKICGDILNAMAIDIDGYLTVIIGYDGQ